MAKKQKQSFVTPAGIAIYPHLHAPDTKWKSDGEYKVKLRFDGADAKKMTKLLDRVYAESQVQAKEKAGGTRKKIKAGPEPYTTDEDGTVVVNFKTKASGVKQNGEKWTRKLPIFDAEGTPVRPGLKIGGGSLLKVSFVPDTYYTALLGAGVTCYLEAVQVLDLKTWDGPSAGTFGFEKEDGFNADEAEDGAFFAGSDDDDEFDPEDPDDDSDADF